MLPPVYYIEFLLPVIKMNYIEWTNKFSVLDHFGLKELIFDRMLSYIEKVTTEPVVIFGGVATAALLERDLDLERDQDIDIMIPPTRDSSVVGLVEYAIHAFMTKHQFVLHDCTGDIQTYDTIPKMVRNIRRVNTYKTNIGDRVSKVQFVFLKHDRTVQESIESADMSCAQVWIELTRGRIYTLSDDARRIIQQGIAFKLWDEKTMTPRQKSHYAKRIAKYENRGFTFRPSVHTVQGVVTSYGEACDLIVRSRIGAYAIVEEPGVLIETVRRKFNELINIFDEKKIYADVQYTYNAIHKYEKFEFTGVAVQIL